MTLGLLNERGMRENRWRKRGESDQGRVSKTLSGGTGVSLLSLFFLRCVVFSLREEVGLLGMIL